MEMKLELVPIPVSDLDRARTFYAEKVGFHVDFDMQPGNGVRIIQLTPPWSACSIAIGTGLGEISEMQPGSHKALHLVVVGIHEAREALASRGVDVSEVIGCVRTENRESDKMAGWLLALFFLEVRLS
ncbi:hypothetical protein KSF_103930 [Reticulibacter mediterranei]|uniref:Glyoxalase/Bleomycin resistance-like N-terminal domain-containing protein n=1 Tax=Reticulibacter mediterranei TaxID=2778369 RepID=A0A8J3N986_9CHLR|nr:VOC family protein [Reticulibacter mediterranei]GHP00346.1 hypothetical protein KSF_103930 [Reticulibacter mediterranei]